MYKMCYVLGVVFGILALAFGGFGTYYKDKFDESKSDQSPININTSTKIDQSVNKSYKDARTKVIVNGTLSPSIEEQRIEKIKKSVSDLYSTDLKVFEGALHYLKLNPDFTKKQIDKIFYLINNERFGNTYQDDLISLVSNKESDVATKFFGERLGMYVPSPDVQYFSKNNIDFKVFLKYLKPRIKQYREPTAILSIIVMNSSYNKTFINNFLNSKEIVDLIFDDLHPNYVASAKTDPNTFGMYGYISKEDFEKTYYFSRISKL